MWTRLHSVLAGAPLGAGMATAVLWTASTPDARQTASDMPVHVLSAAARNADRGPVVFGSPPGHALRIRHTLLRDSARPPLGGGIGP